MDATNQETPKEDVGTPDIAPEPIARNSNFNHSNTDFKDQSDGKFRFSNVLLAD